MSSVAWAWACALWFALGTGTGLGAAGLWRTRTGSTKGTSAPETADQSLARLAVPARAAEGGRQPHRRPWDEWERARL